jgi:hypothetical protein
MNFFSGIALFFVMIMAGSQFAPVVVDHFKGKEVQAQTVQFEAAKHESNIEACATGKTNLIMYAGKVCKGN